MAKLFTFFAQPFSLCGVMNQAPPKIRLYVPVSFSAGQELPLPQGPSHYLAHVMRVREGDSIALFNGSDGEWRAAVTGMAKKSVLVTLKGQAGAQKKSPDLWLAFAPIKSKSELVVEKAVELGVSTLCAVFMRRCVVTRLNHDRLAAHAVEAAEQCGRHDVPALTEYKDLAALAAAWPKERALLYGDERGGGEALGTVLASLAGPPCGVLIGPEGGFAPEEHALLRRLPFARAFGMGPRILRADTAAVAALACVQSWLGDWNEKPFFMSS